MTAIVGVLCQDGVVVGTDSSATFSSATSRTIEQPTEKISIFGDSIIVAGTGQVGHGQRFKAIVDKSLKDGLFNRSAITIAKELSKLTIEDFAYTYSSKGEYGALLAFPANGMFHLCEFAVKDFQPEFKTKLLWYVSLGATQHITDSFLALMREVFWKNEPPSLSDGVFATTWALDHAVAINPGGVNSPVRIATLRSIEKKQLVAEILSDAALGEHRQNIDGAKKALRDYCDAMRMNIETPDVPRP